jgi:prepilin-type N-terminal cleavage/methylation domain-containing protein
MKLTNTQSMKAKSGMTLLELTVVILVLLSLISILFVGARAWKKGSDRSANIMNLRNTQQAMRGHQNMKELNAGVVFTTAELADYMKYPKSIGNPTSGGVGYTDLGVITPQAASPTVANVNHIWLVPSTGAVGGDYGLNDLQDSAGW